MFVIPSIDILNGKCVQLINGKIETATVYGNPIDYYYKWLEKGADILHVVDLDAAFNQGNNKQIIFNLLKKGDLGIQVGGGIRNENYAFELIDNGAKRVIIGSKSLDIEFLKKLRKNIQKDNIMVALDTRYGNIVSNAWQNDTGIPYSKGIRKIKSYAGSILTTDVANEGLLKGPDKKSIEKIAKEKIPTYISGGFTTIDDIKFAQKLGFSGVIVGRALYTKKINFEELW